MRVFMVEQQHALAMLWNVGDSSVGLCKAEEGGVDGSLPGLKQDWRKLCPNQANLTF